MLTHNIRALLTYFNSFEASSSRQFTKEVFTDEYASTALLLIKECCVHCSTSQQPFYLSQTTESRQVVPRSAPPQLLQKKD